MRPTGTKKDGIKYLSEPEMAAFMKATRKNKRDSFLFSLMLYVGGRVSEICQLKLSNVNEGSFQILIQAKKNGTSRHYTMSGKLWKKYRAWMRERAKMNHAAMNPYLFITRDILMVLDVLSFIVSNKERMNIYNYLKSKISESGIKTAYEDLIGIHAIGDKIATFIIRDIGIMNPEVIKYDFGFAFPVDTWVYKIANKLGCKNRNIEKVKECLIEICVQHKIEPLKFAAGLWFLGFHSLDVLLEDCLGKIEI
jgi:hypothetical protein